MHRVLTHGAAWVGLAQLAPAPPSVSVLLFLGACTGLYRWLEVRAEEEYGV